MENNLFFDIFGTLVFGSIGLVCLWQGIAGMVRPIPKCDNTFQKIAKKTGWLISTIGLALIIAIIILWTQR